MINAKTKICLIIGYPVKHSLSPAMHNAGYKALGIDDKFVYLASEVEPKHLKKAINGIRALGIAGASVTAPHKEKIIQYLDKINKQAQKIGAVNTIVNKNGKLIGHNTDWLGAVNPLLKIAKLKDKKAALLGAGGAARAALFGLVEKGAKVKIFNRTKSEAQKLARDFGCEAGGLDKIEEARDCDIIINSTMIGMPPNQNKSLVPAKFIQKNQIIFDMVYAPRETKLVKNALSKGARVVCGSEMLAVQGVEQFRLFTGRSAPEEAMKKALL